MSNYRGLDLSKELQDMYDTIMKIENSETREELVEKLQAIQNELSNKSKIIRGAITTLINL